MLEPVAGPVTVELRDDRRERRDRIARVVTACGGSLAEGTGSGPGEPARPAVALVALDSAERCESHLDAVRRLSREGSRVVAYHDGIGSFSLPERARVLLAGASGLLDSGSPAFERELAGWLERVLAEAAAERDEARQSRAVSQRVGIVAESAPMRAIMRHVQRIGPLSDLPTLIVGETGTGKELVARAVHQLDPKRCDRPFIAVNCGAISAALAESELFGHRRGAFTGAQADRKGLVRTAAGGVLFLDEIGEMDLALQAKLLRVLQEGRVLGVGEDEEVPVDVRVIAATNRDLECMVSREQFRADLFHRLDVLRVKVPPLRDRREDIAPLVEHFLWKHRALAGGEAVAAGRDVLDALERLALAGNVRELENLVRRALVQCGAGAPLRLSDLPDAVWHELNGRERRHEPSACPTPAAPVCAEDVAAGLEPAALLDRNGWSLARTLDAVEKLLIQAALLASDGNQARTARLLGITPRSVYNKLRKHQLEPRARA